jgi:pyruvate dehydrogenase E1 component
LAREFTEGAVRGLYRFAEAPGGMDHRATIIFSGVAHQAATAAAGELAAHYGVGAELWSATSYKLLREEAAAVERHNRLHPSQPPREALVTSLLRSSSGPITAVTDFMRAVPEMICRHIPDGRPYTVLGTDGMGRSDTREALRRHFEVDMPHVVVATLSGLLRVGAIDASLVEDAIRRYGIDADAPDPYVL